MYISYENYFETPNVVEFILAGNKIVGAIYRGANPDFDVAEI